jgi:exodeoxyribonuclease VII small subunit
MSAKPKSTATEPTFETAMDRLEAIVEQMESGKLPLEELIVRYEEGMNMVKVCQERLTAAEQKIEIIARDSAGQAVVKPFEPDAAGNALAPEPERHKNDNSNDDDVSLF